MWDYLKNEHHNLWKALENGPLLYVDGGHSGSALHNEKVKEQPGNEYPLAKLYYQKSFAKVTGMDIQCLGSAENEISSTVTPMSVHDKIHNAISFLCNLYEVGENVPFKHPEQKEQMENWENFKKAEGLNERVECFGNICYASRINKSTKTSDMAKFCTIAVGIYSIAEPELNEEETQMEKELETLKAKRDESLNENIQTLFKMVKASKKLDAIGATYLWAPKDLKIQQWLFNCVMETHDLLHKQRAKKRNRGTGKSSRKSRSKGIPPPLPFAEISPLYIYKLYNILEKLAAEKDIGETALLDITFTKRSGKTEAVEEHINGWIKKQAIGD